MKKFAAVVSLLVVGLAVAIPARAATSTTPSAFNVTASLTSVCQVSTSPTDVAFAYTSFQTGIQSSTGGAFAVRCTTNLPFSIALNASSGTVIGLAYLLSLSASTGLTGVGTPVGYTVNGTMAGSQSGTCATSPTACTGSVTTHTVTVTY